jgi:hypothetical protein
MSDQMEKIIQAFAEVSRRSVADLLGHYGPPDLRRQRKILWALLRDMTTATNAQIAARFSGRDASTVSEAVAMIRGEAAVLQNAAGDMADWRLRVEQRLRSANPKGALRIVRHAGLRGRPTGDEWEALVTTLMSVEALLTAPGLTDTARLSGLRAVMDREVAA